MRHTNRFFILIAALSLSLAAGSPALAQLVENGGFETGDFTDWTQGGNTAFTSVVTASPGNYFVNSGLYAAALGPNTTGTLTSNTFTDVAGKPYTLSFWLYGDNGGTDSFEALVDGVVVVPAFDDSTLAYQQYTATFIGTGGSSNSLELEFDDTNTYMFLDDVSIAPKAPEPSSFLLLGTGICCGLALFRRRLFHA